MHVSNSAKAAVKVKPQNLTNNEWLRKQHIINGHCGATRLIKIVLAMTAARKLSPEDWKQFLREGCGACDSFKLRMPSVGPSLKDATPLAPCKKWIFDQLKLRVPSFKHGFLYLNRFISPGNDDHPDITMSFGMTGHEAEDVIKTIEQQRARIRPFHGEVLIMKADSHPAHKSLHVENYFASASPQSMDKQIAPPRFHQGVSKVEVSFSKDVPSSMALLRGAPDLGESHFHMAFRYTEIGSLYTTFGKNGKSAAQVLFNLDHAPPNPISHAFGSAGKRVVHPEIRESKFDEKDAPCVYMGPPLDSTEYVTHCSVYNGMDYADELTASLTIDERAVLQRTMRNHPCHQPFGHNTQATALADADAKPGEYDLATDEALPHVSWPVWTALDAPPEVPFSVGLGSGEERPGDIASWCNQLSDAGHQHIRVDLKVGGYEHDLRRADIRESLQELASHANCAFVHSAVECGPWSPLRFAPGKPDPIFTTQFPDGIIDPDTHAVHEDAVRALDLLKAFGDVMSNAIDKGAEAIFELQVEYNKDSPHAGTAEVRNHSTSKSTTYMKNMIAKHKLVSIFTDQCMSDATTRKPTELLCTPKIAAQVRSVLGTLRCTPGHADHTEHSDTLKGKDADGNFNSKKAGRYTSLFAMRTALCCIVATDLGPTESKPRDVADLYPVGMRVEVLWPVDRVYYRGTVVKSWIATYKAKGIKLKTRRVQVEYDMDGRVMPHDLHNSELRESEEALQTAAEIADIKLLGALLKSDPSGVWLVNTLTDITTGDIEHELMLYVLTAPDHDPITSVDTRDAWAWHCPRNEREYLRSPQRALWRTARELKMDEYEALNMFEDVYLKDIQNEVKYRFTWAGNIKNDGTAQRKFEKLNPRLCIVGTGMDREVYPSRAETLKMMSFKGILALKAAYYDYLCPFSFDLGNAFQSTRTDFDKSTGEPLNMPPLYTYGVPGFEKKGPNGEPMGKKVNVGMQGRIDAAKLTNDNFYKLVKKCSFTRMLSDPQCYLYFNHPLANTDASLIDILNAIVALKPTDDSPPGHAPIGFAVCGLHVDDGFGDACDVAQSLDHATNRVVQYLTVGLMAEYVVKLGGWKKQLGFLLTCHDDLKMVEMSAPGQLADLCDKLLTGVSIYQPKHILMQDAFDLPAGEVPAPDDPGYAAYMEMRALVGYAIGAGIYLENCCPKLTTLINVMSQHTHRPSYEVLKHLRHGIMHMKAYPEWAWFGGNSVGLEQAAELADITVGATPMHYHHYSDAGLGSGTISYTGGQGMLAAGPWVTTMLRQHLASPYSHSAEVTAAGTNLNTTCAGNDWLQELHIRLGKPTPFYLDSQSTVFVAKGAAAVKKTVWLTRRAAVLQEGVQHDEILPIHVSEKHMLADPFTKYLKQSVWYGHMRRIHNLPPRAQMLKVSPEDTLR